MSFGFELHDGRMVWLNNSIVSGLFEAGAGVGLPTDDIQQLMDRTMGDGQIFWLRQMSAAELSLLRQVLEAGALELTSDMWFGTYKSSEIAPILDEILADPNLAAAQRLAN